MFYILFNQPFYLVRNVFDFTNFIFDHFASVFDSYNFEDFPFVLFYFVFFSTVFVVVIVKFVVVFVVIVVVVDDVVVVVVVSIVKVMMKLI